VYNRGNLVFVFNFSPHASYTDYVFPCEPSKFRIVLNTDSGRYGGWDRIDERIIYYTIPTAGIDSPHYLRLYLPARSAFVMRKEPYKRIK